MRYTFFHISSRPFHDHDVKLKFQVSPDDMNTRELFLFFFLNLVTFLYNATPEKFIRAMNFETPRILFLRNVFAPVVVVVIRELKMETFSGRRRTGLAEKAWN